MTTTRADAHDLDKLERWRPGLEGKDESTFPVFAIFLVSAEDRLAHDIFRKYRDSFTKGNAGFHHLVIFGQHGLSTAVTGFLAELNRPMETLPCLALASDAGAREVNVLNLPAGGHPAPVPALEKNDNLDQPWQLVLDQVESAVEKGSKLVDLAGIPGVTTLELKDKSLIGLVKGLLSKS
ncbi:MAG: hypothetical protein BZY88_07145 [SAR202 cluster bacterium Io17-Chloro-G9]|nr:MAG: hypothetical protein BZY88_07145 [SAR202 cluster bacterium Io17-Chloro-G9]